MKTLFFAFTSGLCVAGSGVAFNQPQSHHFFSFVYCQFQSSFSSRFNFKVYFRFTAHGTRHTHRIDCVSELIQFFVFNLLVSSLDNQHISRRNRVNRVESSQKLWLLISLVNAMVLLLLLLLLHARFVFLNESHIHFVDSKLFYDEISNLRKCLAPKSNADAWHCCCCCFYSSFCAIIINNN